MDQREESSMSNPDVTAARAMLRVIAELADADAHRDTGEPYGLARVAVQLGRLLAMVKQLAEVVESLLPPEDEPERDPVPYKDYLPESHKCAHIRPCWDIACRGGGA
jgi:hypothetical protein